MRTHRLVLSLILRPAVVTGFACLAILAAGGVVRAQNPVTTTDLTRLDTTADDIAKRADALKTTDPTLATDVTKSLADLRDDITYLKVKLRRGEPVSRDEYTTLHDKLETLRVRAQGEKVTAQPVLPPAGRVLTVQVGTQLDVRLQTPLNSGTTKVEQRFEATTLLDLKVNDEVVVPAGSVVRGFVSSVSPAGRLDRRGSMTLSFDQVVLAKPTRLRASVVEALDGKMSEDITRLGAGAAVGAIIGGIIGGGKGALVGVLVGTGGTMASTEGVDVTLPVGTVLRIRLDEPLNVEPGGA